MAFLIEDLLLHPPVGRPLGRQQRAKLSRLLVSLAASVLDETSSDEASDAPLKALHDRYSELAYDQITAQEQASVQVMLKGLGLGVRAEDLQGLSLPEMMCQVAEQFFKQEDAQAEAQARKKPLSAAAQARREQAEREVGLSVREVYRKLVSALHPDREADPQERERKPALMQRVNQAYEAQDLLTLLTLQIEIEQIDAADLATLPAQRIAHYNKVLTEQCEELRAEVMAHVFRFAMVAGEELPLDPEIITPLLIDQMLSQDIRMLRGKIQTLEDDLVAFRDRKYLGAWLKGLR